MCGLAREGGLTADQSLADTHGSIVGARLARESDLTANQSPPDVRRPTVGASLLAMTALQATMFIDQKKHQNLPTSFSGCPSEVDSLTFGCRCQFSDRDCKPADSLLDTFKRTYNRGA